MIGWINGIIIGGAVAGILMHTLPDTLVWEAVSIVIGIAAGISSAKFVEGWRG